MERQGSTLVSYIVGFALSLVLTAGAYLVVTQKLFTGGWRIGSIVLLAVAQVLVQLFFFLHLGREARPRWKLVVLLFMLLVLGIVVIGSLWIMQSLDYHMHPEDVSNSIIRDEGINP